ncbi:MAG: DegV family protein, partial [Clostridia bacterium]
MNKIFVFSDITCDYPKSRMKDNMDILSFSLTLGEDVYDYSTPEIDCSEFYNRLKSGEKANTAMLNQFYFEEKLKDVLDKGFDVMYLCFSSALSGSFAMADKVAGEFGVKYPKQKIKVVNSFNASIGEGLLLEYLLKKRDAGAKFDELVEYTINLVDHVCSYFTVSDLKHLASLGR